MKTSRFKYFFSFRKFIFIREYDEDMQWYDYNIYGRVGLFHYAYITDVDSSIYDKLDEFYN